MVRSWAMVMGITVLAIGTIVHAADDKTVAVAMVDSAAVLIKAQGVEKGIEAINNAEGPFVKGELYVFAYDSNAVMMAHPKNPKLIGKNLMEVPDVDGKLFRKEIVTLAKSKGSGWVDYKYKNPTSNAIEAKTTYVKKAGTLVLCCGIYKE